MAAISHGPPKGSEPARRRFTGAEVLAMLEAGILDADEPVELLNGELIVVSPQGPSHRTLTVVIRELLRQACGPDVHVQDHSPIVASEHSMPEPDVAVIRGAPREYLSRLPAAGDVEIVVEIAVTELPAALAKVPVYAAAGVPVYWLVDVGARTVTVYSAPRPGASEYGSVVTESAEGSVLPPGASAPVGVSALLP